jgi:mono/diheme cytochrome c family protein
MRKILKWIGIVLAGLVSLLVLAAIVLIVYASARFKPTLANRPLYPITADTSSEGVARGKYLMEEAMGCDEACHSPEGKPFNGTYESVSEGPISGVFAVPNLTPDEDTGLGDWTDAEIARAIREGVDKDGVGLVIMPSSYYHSLSDADVAAIVGYLRRLPPVDNEIPPLSLNTVAKIILALGVFGSPSVGEPIISAQSNPQPGTVEHGKYMVDLGFCRECHRANLAGGPLPFAEPGFPAAANLTPAGNLPGWSEAEFIAAVKTGAHPGGGQLHEGMPRYNMTDEDLATIYKYLQTLPPTESKK